MKAFSIGIFIAIITLAAVYIARHNWPAVSAYLLAAFYKGREIWREYYSGEAA